MFDIGGVLLDWNPRYLYRKLFDDEDAMNRFLEEVCTLDWHAAHDRGTPFEVSCAQLAAVHPELVRSFAAIETGLPGFGLEMLADVTHGGAWHIGVLAAPGIPEMLLAGREREFLAGYAYPAMCATDGAITDQDVDEFTSTFARPDGFRGASGLYRSMLQEGDEIRELATRSRLQMPVLAIGAGSGPGAPANGLAAAGYDDLDDPLTTCPGLYQNASSRIA